MRGIQPFLAAPLQRGVAGHERAILEDADRVRQYVDVEYPSPRRVRHAVEIAADADHAFVRGASLQSEHCLIRAEGRDFMAVLSSAKASLTTRWVVACTRGLATVSSQWRSWPFRSSRLRKTPPRKKSSRI